MVDQEQQPLPEGAGHAAIITQLERKILRYFNQVKDLEGQLTKANFNQRCLSQECEEEMKKHGQCRNMLNKMIENNKCDKELAHQEREQETGQNPQPHRKLKRQEHQCTDTIPQQISMQELTRTCMASNEQPQNEMAVNDRVEDVCEYKARISQLEIENAFLKEKNALLNEENSQLKQEKPSLCNIESRKLQALINVLEASCSELEYRLVGTPVVSMGIEETKQDVKDHVIPAFDRPSPVVCEDTQPGLSIDRDFWQWADARVDVDKNDYFYYTVQPPPQLMKGHPWEKVKSDIKLKPKLKKSLRNTKSCHL